jgi:DNA polymerase
MTDEKKLINLDRKVKSCKKCGLWRTRKNTVFGEGPHNAKIMAIGQAPGAQENETGKPFIGRSGKFLNQLLKLANIEREKIFITSPLKCFPPKNRKPDKSEIKTCLPYLKEQLEIINPQKIILLGGVAFSVFFPDRKLKDFRGKTIKEAGRDFFVSYHPSAGIRFQKTKKILEKDFKKLKCF